MDTLWRETPLGRWLGQPDASSIQSVADVGCGSLAKNCSLMKEFLAGRKCSHLVGTDISYNSLALAQAYHPDVSFIQADTLHLPLAADSFDLVIATGTVHHMTDPHGGVREILRVVKPGQFVYLSVYSKSNIYYWFYRASGGLRFLHRRGLGWLVNVLCLPFYAIGYWAINLLATRQWRFIPLKEVVMDFYDKLMVPVAHFFDQEEFLHLIGPAAVIVSTNQYALGMMRGALIRKKSG